MPTPCDEVPRDSAFAQSLHPVGLGALSHPGRLRDNNEDHYLVMRLSRTFECLMTNLPPGDVPSRVEEGGWAVLVADGMGGAAAGEVASRMALTTLVRGVLDVPDWILRVDERTAAEITRRAVEHYRRVHDEVASLQQRDPSLAGMGTTMTVAYSIGEDGFVGHVGDSRAYLYGGGTLRRLTRDHTHVQRLLDSGLIAPDPAANHRLRSLLTQAVGARGLELSVDVQPVRLHDGDLLLLCTDGLTDMVGEEAIAEVLAFPEPAQQICQRLVDLALEGGGRDNVTVVLARYGLD